MVFFRSRSAPATLIMLNHHIGFVGTGQMARALARGLVARGLVPADRIWGFDPEPEALRQFEAEVPGVRRATADGEVARRSDIVILAVKPQSFAVVAQSLAELPAADSTIGDPVSGSRPGGGAPIEQPLFLSILAGVSLETLCAGLRTRRVVRVMPNTPCLVGQGASGYAVAEGAAGDAALVEQLLSAVGLAFPLPEKLLDAVTGLSGSGPA